MKKISLMMLILVLMLLISGCGGNSQPTATVEEQPTNESQAVSTEVSEEQEEEEVVILSGKTGQELIDSLEIVSPEKLYIRGTSFSEDLVVETVMYVYQGKTRTETISAEGDQVSIYDESEGVMYSYSESDGVGMVFYDDDEYEDDDDEYVESDTVFGEDLFSDMEGILVNAELKNYEGHEVVYIETATNSPDGEWVTKQWVATEFWYPIKFESIFNGKLIGGYDTQEITRDFEVTDDLFTVPVHIETIVLMSRVKVNTLF